MNMIAPNSSKVVMRTKAWRTLMVATTNAAIEAGLIEFGPDLELGSLIAMKDRVFDFSLNGGQVLGRVCLSSKK